MADYTITHAWRVDDYGVVQTLEDFSGLIVGSDINISGLSQTNLNGNHTVYSLEPYEFLGVDDDGDLLWNYSIPRMNQVLFVDAGDDIDRTTDSGTLAYTPTCTWITNAQVTEFLGISAATANDTAYITTCVAAANAFASRRRRAAGYFDDSLSTAPSGDVKLGTTLYAAALYRERGSVDSFASFEQLGPAQAFGSMGRILQLLGVNRPQVG
jgi:hypothetical protein